LVAEQGIYFLQMKGTKQQMRSSSDSCQSQSKGFELDLDEVSHRIIEELVVPFVRGTQDVVPTVCRVCKYVNAMVEADGGWQRMVVLTVFTLAIDGPLAVVLPGIDCEVLKAMMPLAIDAIMCLLESSITLQVEHEIEKGCKGCWSLCFHTRKNKTQNAAAAAARPPRIRPSMVAAAAPASALPPPPVQKDKEGSGKQIQAKQLKKKRKKKNNQKKQSLN